MKGSTLWKSWVKSSLHNHNTEIVIVGYNILYLKLFPGHGFHKIVTFQWLNWVKNWTGAFSIFLSIYIGVNSEKIIAAATLHFLQMILIWVWDINETYVFILKFKVPCSLLPGSVVKFLISLYQFFTKIIIRTVPWQNKSNFLSVIWNKFSVNVQQCLLICWTNGKWVNKDGRKEASKEVSKQLRK